MRPKLYECIRCRRLFPWIPPHQHKGQIVSSMPICDWCLYDEQLQDFENQIAAGDDYDGKGEAHCG